MGIEGQAEASEHLLQGAVTAPEAALRRVLIQIAPTIFASPARPMRMFTDVPGFGSLPGVVEEKFP